MTQTLTEPESADATSARRAVIYLRVSSSGQVGRENDVEGYSIPAQREACRRKAQSLSWSTSSSTTPRAPAAPTDHSSKRCSTRSRPSASTTS
jgi:hypothetical protein